MGPWHQFVGSNLLSRKQPRLFGDFHGPPLANSTIECNLALPLEASSGYKSWPVETLHPPLLWVLIVILGSFHCIRFPHHPQVPPNSNCLSPVFSPSVPSPHHHLIPPLPSLLVPRPLIKSTLFPTREIPMSPQHPYSEHNLSGSTDWNTEVLKLIFGDGCNSVSILNTILITYFKWVKWMVYELHSIKLLKMK